MSVIHKQKMDIPAAWKGKDIKDDGSWIYHWSDESIAVLEKGLAAVKAKGLTAPNFTKEDFLENRFSRIEAADCIGGNAVFKSTNQILVEPQYIYPHSPTILYCSRVRLC